MTRDQNELREAEEMARCVIAHHLGGDPAGIRHLPSGISNLVFGVDHQHGSFVIRISPEPAKLQAFVKEQWVISKAREAGVPTAEILEVGCSVIPQPYMISRTVEGQEGSAHPGRHEILLQLGQYGAMINSVHTEGFGETFDWSSNRLSFNARWDDFLRTEFKVDERILLLEGQGMLGPGQSERIRQALGGVEQRDLVPKLCHGDLRLKNTIVSPQGRIVALIDWEHCISSIAPAWDLSIALHDLSIDEKQTLLDGYGVSEDDLFRNAALIKALNILHYAPMITALDREREAELLRHYRIRLSGALDSYCI